jgi:YD repeat-containing protein
MDGQRSRCSSSICSYCKEFSPASPLQRPLRVRLRTRSVSASHLRPSKAHPAFLPVTGGMTGAAPSMPLASVAARPSQSSLTKRRFLFLADRRSSPMTFHRCGSASRLRRSVRARRRASPESAASGGSCVRQRPISGLGGAYGVIFKVERSAPTTPAAMGPDLGETSKIPMEQQQSRASEAAIAAAQRSQKQPLGETQPPIRAGRAQTRRDAGRVEVVETYFDTAGRPIKRKGVGAARISRAYDAQGHQVEESYFNAEGKPTVRKDLGASRISWRYDSDGRQVERTLFRPDGTPVDSRPAAGRRALESA